VPENPNPKLHVSLAKLRARTAPDSLPFAELGVTTNFSFLRGASHADELIVQAAALGYRAIGVTDLNSLAGAVRMHVAAKEVGLKLVVGCRLKFRDHPDVLVWPTNREGYAQLCKLLALLQMG
jgi:error-prone DNA polymerase